MTMASPEQESGATVLYDRHRTVNYNILKHGPAHKRLQQQQQRPLIDGQSSSSGTDDHANSTTWSESSDTSDTVATPTSQQRVRLLQEDEDDCIYQAELLYSISPCEDRHRDWDFIDKHNSILSEEGDDIGFHSFAMSELPPLNDMDCNFNDRYMIEISEDENDSMERQSHALCSGGLFVQEVCCTTPCSKSKARKSKARKGDENQTEKTELDVSYTEAIVPFNNREPTEAYIPEPDLLISFEGIDGGISESITNGTSGRIFLGMAPDGAEQRKIPELPQIGHDAHESTNDEDETISEEIINGTPRELFLAMSSDWPEHSRTPALQSIDNITHQSTDDDNNEAVVSTGKALSFPSPHSRKGTRMDRMMKALRVTKRRKRFQKVEEIAELEQQQQDDCLADSIFESDGESAAHSGSSIDIGRTLPTESETESCEGPATKTNDSHYSHDDDDDDDDANNIDTKNAVLNLSTTTRRSRLERALRPRRGKQQSKNDYATLPFQRNRMQERRRIIVRTLTVTLKRETSLNNEQFFMFVFCQLLYRMSAMTGNRLSYKYGSPIRYVPQTNAVDRVQNFFAGLFLLLSWLAENPGPSAKHGTKQTVVIGSPPPVVVGLTDLDDVGEGEDIDALVGVELKTMIDILDRGTDMTGLQYLDAHRFLSSDDDSDDGLSDEMEMCNDVEDLELLDADKFVLLNSNPSFKPYLDTAIVETDLTRLEYIDAHYVCSSLEDIDDEDDGMETELLQLRWAEATLALELAEARLFGSDSSGEDGLTKELGSLHSAEAILSHELEEIADEEMGSTSVETAEEVDDNPSIDEANNLQENSNEGGKLLPANIYDMDAKSALAAIYNVAQALSSDSEVWDGSDIPEGSESTFDAEAARRAVQEALLRFSPENTAALRATKAEGTQEYQQFKHSWAQQLSTLPENCHIEESEEDTYTITLGNMPTASTLSDCAGSLSVTTSQGLESTLNSDSSPEHEFKGVSPTLLSHTASSATLNTNEPSTDSRDVLRDSHGNIPSLLNATTSSTTVEPDCVALASGSTCSLVEIIAGEAQTGLPLSETQPTRVPEQERDDCCGCSPRAMDGSGREFYTNEDKPYSECDEQTHAPTLEAISHVEQNEEDEDCVHEKDEGRSPTRNESSLKLKKARKSARKNVDKTAQPSRIQTILSNARSNKSRVKTPTHESVNPPQFIGSVDDDSATMDFPMSEIQFSRDSPDVSVLATTALRAGICAGLFKPTSCRHRTQVEEDSLDSYWQRYLSYGGTNPSLVSIVSIDHSTPSDESPIECQLSIHHDESRPLQLQEQNDDDDDVQSEESRKSSLNVFRSFDSRATTSFNDETVYDPVWSLAPLLESFSFESILEAASGDWSLAPALPATFLDLDSQASEGLGYISGETLRYSLSSYLPSTQTENSLYISGTDTTAMAEVNSNDCEGFMLENHIEDLTLRRPRDVSELFPGMSLPSCQTEEPANYRRPRNNSSGTIRYSLNDPFMVNNTRALDVKLTLEKIQQELSLDGIIKTEDLPPKGTDAATMVENTPECKQETHHPFIGRDRSQSLGSDGGSDCDLDRYAVQVESIVDDDNEVHGQKNQPQNDAGPFQSSAHEEKDSNKANVNVKEAGRSSSWPRLTIDIPPQEEEEVEGCDVVPTPLYNASSEESKDSISKDTSPADGCDPAETNSDAELDKFVPVVGTTEEKVHQLTTIGLATPTRRTPARRGAGDPSGDLTHTSPISPFNKGIDNRKLDPPPTTPQRQTIDKYSSPKLDSSSIPVDLSLTKYRSAVDSQITSDSVEKDLNLGSASSTSLHQISVDGTSMSIEMQLNELVMDSSSNSIDSNPYKSLESDSDDELDATDTDVPFDEKRRKVPLTRFIRDNSERDVPFGGRNYYKEADLCTRSHYSHSFTTEKREECPSMTEHETGSIRHEIKQAAKELFPEETNHHNHHNALSSRRPPKLQTPSSRRQRNDETRSQRAVRPSSSSKTRLIQNLCDDSPRLIAEVDYEEFQEVPTLWRARNTPTSATATTPKFEPYEYHHPNQTTTTREREFFPSSAPTPTPPSPRKDYSGLGDGAFAWLSDISGSSDLTGTEGTSSYSTSFSGSLYDDDDDDDDDYDNFGDNINDGQFIGHEAEDDKISYYSPRPRTISILPKQQQQQRQRRRPGGVTITPTTHHDAHPYWETKISWHTPRPKTPYGKIRGENGELFDYDVDGNQEWCSLDAVGEMISSLFNWNVSGSNSNNNNGRGRNTNNHNNIIASRDDNYILGDSDDEEEYVPRYEAVAQ